MSGILNRQNMLMEMAISQYSDRAVFSVCQVINGLMERPDWEQAIKTPLGILPGGSGNALAASVHHYSG